jgi:hypothetical protein
LEQDSLFKRKTMTTKKRLTFILYVNIFTRS